MILAAGHISRSGKSEFARAIQDAAGDLGVPVARASFAGLLKRTAHRLWRNHGLRDGEFYETPAGAAIRDVPLPGIGKSPVQIWIEYGMAVRSVHPPTWLEACLSQARPGELLVISDVRFDNEANAIQAMGGWCVRVDRPGAPVKGSDREIRADFPWDAVIANDGTLAELRAKAAAVARRYLEEAGW